MRLVIALALVLTYAPPVLAQQPEQVVVPTYTPEQTCYQSVPCAATVCYQTVPCTPPAPRVEAPPCPLSVATLPCGAQTQPVVVRYEMRSKALFWTGALMVAGGVTLVVASMTWQQQSVPTAYASLPCGTDPYFAQRATIAPCQVNGPLLAAGVSMAGTGGLLMYLGSEKVAVGTDGKHVTVRVRF